jgi:hypothetical protein
MTEREREEREEYLRGLDRNFPKMMRTLEILFEAQYHVPIKITRTPKNPRKKESAG